MNNNILNLVNSISETYKLTPQETQALINKYQSDTRDLKTIETELNTYANYFQIQNKKTTIINNTPPLANGNNYYVMTFDNTGHIILEGVTINITNQETSEITINNSFKGTLKHSAVDDLEIAIFQIGRLLNFDLTEEYHIYNSNKQKDGIIVKDLINNNEFYNTDNLKKRIQKLINSGKIKKEKWMDAYQKLTVANDKEDYISAINYGLNILKNLPSILEEDYKEIEKQYINMILFDSIINQSERKFTDYGIICNKETKRYTYAPLYDNVFPSIFKNNDVFYLNGIACNRYEIMECIFYNYYDKIKDKVEYIITNKDKLLKNIDIIAKYNLDLNTYIMLINNITTNLNYMEKLYKERTLSNQNPNAGFADIATVGITLLIIIIFSVGIAYLLYCIK